jgi:uncharacterized protein DUF4136
LLELTYIKALDHLRRSIYPNPKGGSVRTYFRFRAVTAAVLASVVFGGCSTTSTSTYSYEPRANFKEFKTYQWAEPRQTFGQDSLTEANVRFVADRELAAKGLALNADKADLLIGLGGEFGYSYYSFPYELRRLTLNVSRVDNKQLVWRGTATGPIRTDAASGDLKKAVEEMLANFPPK